MRVMYLEMSLLAMRVATRASRIQPRIWAVWADMATLTEKVSPFAVADGLAPAAATLAAGLVATLAVGAGVATTGLI